MSKNLIASQLWVPMNTETWEVTFNYQRQASFGKPELSLSPMLAEGWNAAHGSVMAMSLDQFCRLVGVDSTKSLCAEIKRQRQAYYDGLIDPKSTLRQRFFPKVEGNIVFENWDTAQDFEEESADKHKIPIADFAEWYRVNVLEESVTAKTVFVPFSGQRRSWAMPLASYFRQSILGIDEPLTYLTVVVEDNEFDTIDELQTRQMEDNARSLASNYNVVDKVAAAVDILTRDGLGVKMKDIAKACDLYTIPTKGKYAGQLRIDNRKAQTVFNMAKLCFHALVKWDVDLLQRFKMERPSLVDGSIPYTENGYIPAASITFEDLYYLIGSRSDDNLQKDSPLVAKLFADTKYVQGEFVTREQFERYVQQVCSGEKTTVQTLGRKEIKTAQDNIGAKDFLVSLQEVLKAIQNGDTSFFTLGNLQTQNGIAIDDDTTVNGQPYRQIV